MDRCGRSSTRWSLSTSWRDCPTGGRRLSAKVAGWCPAGKDSEFASAARSVGDTPRLVILDEAFHGLERARRTALLDATRKAWANATLLCVTHDVTDTLALPRVLVVDGGRIVEDDAPARLAARPSRYRSLLEAERAAAEHVWGRTSWRRLELRAR